MAGGTRHMPTVCFVTYELAPINAGGVGTYITRIIPRLADRLRVIVLAGMSPPDVAAYRQLGLHDPDGAGRNRVVSIDDVAPVIPDHPNVFVRNTQRFAHALSALCRDESIDLIEMPEYAGMAYGALKARRQHGAFGDQQLVVRLHGSLELIDYHGKTTNFTLERRMIYGMERYAMRHADVLVAPTRETFADYERFYGLERSPVVCRPPVGEAAPVSGAGSGASILYVGRVQAIKGVDLFIRAAVRWLADGAPDQVRFRIIGLDVVPEHESFRTFVDALIPPAMRTRFEFLGHRTAGEIANLAREARLGVVPSRWESFGYVPRELLAIGLPVIGPRIAGFQELEGSPGMTFFDGSVGDLTEAMKRVWSARPSVVATNAPPPDATMIADVYADLASAAQARRGRRPPVPPSGSVSRFVFDDVAPARPGAGDPTAPAAPAHQLLRDWLELDRSECLVVALPQWDSDDAAVQAAVSLLCSDPQVSAVELPPRCVPAGLLGDRDARLLGLTEYDGSSDGILGIAPAAVVLRRPHVLPDLLPGSPHDVMRQLVAHLARDGEVELAWPPDEVPGWPVVAAATATDPLVAVQNGGDPRQRWLLGYLGRFATERPATPWTAVVGPVYLVRRSWQLLRQSGVRGYLRKIGEVARRS